MDTTATVGNEFATGLYHKLAGIQASKNLFLSPFSIQVALAMCAVGARGETRRVLADLIGAPESIEEQHRQYARLLKSVHGEGQRPFELAMANALWGHDSYHVNIAFQEAIADYYDGALHQVNFRDQPDEAVRAINSWVSGKTRDKIKELIQRDFNNEDTRLILTNAIYFKGQWDQPFKETHTRDEDWQGPNGITGVPMMHRSGSYLYYEGDGCQAVDILYKGRQLSMLILLPRKQSGVLSLLLGKHKDGLTALEGKWVAEGIYQKVTAGLRHEETVIVSLPRFRMESEFRLKPVLCALGAELAFSDDADFSGIGGERLKISEVVHKAFVEVNEEGTEAAAATATGMMLAKCALVNRPAQPKVFKADHPFVFFIRDTNTNAVLFCGRVLDPT